MNENEIPDIKMKSWRIDFVRNKRDETVSVTTYTLQLAFGLIVILAGVIATGVIMIMAKPVTIRIILFVFSLIIVTPFIVVSFTSKQRLTKIIKKGYYPKTQIDIDRYVLAEKYYKLKVKVPASKLGFGATFTSNFEDKRILHEKRKSLAKSLFKKRKRKDY